MKKIFLVVVALIVLVGSVIFFASKKSMPKDNSRPVVVLETSAGSIAIELYATDAPKTVENFLTLAEKGFYDGLTFHRVIPGFMIQGGDPNCGSANSSRTPTGPCGTGGPGYAFEDEFDSSSPSYQNGYRRGTVAMANAGPNTNGSQFFIMHTDYPLPHQYTIFGRVLSGLEAVDKIAVSPKDKNDRPRETISIQKAYRRE